MIKVAHIRWCEPIGGVERVLRDLAVYHDRQQFSVCFFFLGRGGPYVEEIRASGNQVSIIHARSGYSPVMRWHLVQALRTFHPDLIHEHGIPPLVRPLLNWWIGAPLLVFEHGEIKINQRKGKPWLNWLHGLERRHFSRLVVVNSFTNGRLAQSVYHIPENRIRVVHLGIDLSIFSGSKTEKPSFKSDEMILGYVGRIQNYDKGTDYLPQIAYHLKQRNFNEFKIIVVGDGPDRETVIHQARSLGVCDKLVFKGRQNNVSDLMANMDILLMPSRFEAFGLAAIEALSVGTRVVAFAVDGLTEVIADCSEARLVSPGNVISMVESVLDLWQKYKKQRSAATVGFVAERYDVHRMVAEIEEIYKELLKRN
jgi:glycosyltransferase involved in cell wall biosynthesis